MKLQNLMEVKSVFAPLVNMKLPIRVSYKIFHLIKAIEMEEQFFEKRLQGIINEYGQTDENGQYILDNGNIKIIKGKETDCQLALDELNNVEVERPNIEFTLGELEEITLSVQDVNIIQDFIKEE